MTVIIEITVNLIIIINLFCTKHYRNKCNSRDSRYKLFYRRLRAARGAQTHLTSRSRIHARLDRPLYPSILPPTRIEHF